MLKDDELIGKFIKYSPEISEEVFDKIITRLQKAGFTQTNRSEDRCDWLGTTYKDFQKHQFLWITGIWYDRKNIFSLDNNSQHCTEISYKDIIGEEEWWKNLKKGDYVVSIKVKREYNINNIFQVKESNSEIIITELDNKNSTTNGWHRINFRLATPEEAKMYEHAGRPVDITTYKLPLAQESLKVEDLVEGEIYSDNDVIFISKNKNNGNGIRISTGSLAKNNEFDISKKDIRIGNSEERQWLSVCIQEDKFIPKEDVAKYMKPKFEVGKWYKNICNGEYIAKLTGIINGDKFPSIEYIYKNKYETTYSSVYFSMSSCKDAIECTLEEIQQYLPEGHVDKIKSFTVHNKCNIGDIIVSLEPDYSTTRKNGDLHKVLDGDKYSLYFASNRAIAKEHSNTYRLATPQEIEMYNKGIKNIYDKVKKEQKYFDNLSQHIGRYIKALVDGPNAGSVKKGEIGKIIDNGYVDFPSQEGYSCSQALTKEMSNRYELLPESYVPEGEFVLPEKWFILNIYPEVREYLSKKYNINCINWNYEYIGWDGCSTDKGVHGCCLRSFRNGTVEITLEQFKKYVLKEEIKSMETWTVGTYVVAIKDGHARCLPQDKYKIGFIGLISHKFSDNTFAMALFSENCCNKDDFIWFATKEEAERFARTLPKKSDMEDILLEAKRRFPVGCEYEGVMTYGPYIATGKLKSNTTIDGIAIFDDFNCIYKNGQWASVISSPEEKEEKISWDISWKCATDYWRIPTKEDEELLNSFNKPELLLRDENEPVIFPNIKRERIVEIKIKLVD